MTGRPEDIVARLLEKWTSAESLGLHCGEMTAQEVRTAKAVATAVINEAATDLTTLTQKLEAWEAWAEGLTPAEISAGTAKIVARAQSAEQRIAALEASLSVARAFIQGELEMRGELDRDYDDSAASTLREIDTALHPKQENADG